MAGKYALHVDSARLCITDEKTGQRLEYANRVVVNGRRGLILALGEEEEAVRGRLGNQLAGEPLDTLTLFGADAAHLAYEVRVIGHLTRLLNRQTGAPGGLVATKPGRGAAYTVQLPGYELFPPARRRSLEHALQVHFRVRRLTVNGEERAIPAHRRELEIRVRRMLVRVLPAAAAVAAYFLAPAGLRAERLAFAACILAVLLGAYYGGRVLWMLAARRIVPVEYCRFLLRDLRGRASAVDEWLARAIWGTDSAQ